VVEVLAILFGTGPVAVVVFRVLVVAVVVVGGFHTVLEEVAVVLLSRAFWRHRTSCLGLHGDDIVAAVIEVDSLRIPTIVVVEVVVLCLDHIPASIFALCVVLRKTDHLVLHMLDFHVHSLLNMMMVMLHYQLDVLVADAGEIPVVADVSHDPRAHIPEVAERPALDDRNPNLLAILEFPAANHQFPLCFVFLFLFFAVEIALMPRHCAFSFHPQIEMPHVHPLVSALVLMHCRLSCIESFLLVVVLAAACSEALLESSGHSVVVVVFFLVDLDHLLVALVARFLYNLHNSMPVVRIFRGEKMKRLDLSLKVVRVVSVEVVGSVVVEGVLVRWKFLLVSVEAAQRDDDQPQGEMRRWGLMVARRALEIGRLMGSEWIGH